MSVSAPEMDRTAAQSDADRREFERFSAPSTVASGEWSRILDLSLGGACLEGAAPVAKGDHLEVILTDAQTFHTAMIEAEVVWKHGARAGLRWISAEEREREWLQARCRNC